LITAKEELEDASASPILTPSKPAGEALSHGLLSLVMKIMQIALSLTLSKLTLHKAPFISTSREELITLLLALGISVPEEEPTTLETVSLATCQ